MQRSPGPARNVTFTVLLICITVASQHTAFISAIALTMASAPPDASSSPTLYYVPRTIGSPIYQILLELGLASGPGLASCHGSNNAAQVNVKTLSFSDIKTEEYLRDINPMGTSPAFKHENHPTQGKIQLFESGAILSWILEEYDTSNIIHPAPGQPGRASFLFIQQYIIATVYPFVASLFLHTLKPAEEQDADYVKQSKSKFTELLAPTLERLKSAESDWMLGGKEPSAVDFLLAKPLGNADSLGLLGEFSKLKKILTQIKKRPSYCKAYGTECQHHSAEEMRTLVLVPCDCSSGL